MVADDERRASQRPINHGSGATGSYGAAIEDKPSGMEPDSNLKDDLGAPQGSGTKGSREDGCIGCGDPVLDDGLTDIVDESEQSSILANRCLYECGWGLTGLYLCMIAVSTFLIIWMLLGNHESTWWFVLLEVLVTAVIVIEVLTNIIAQRQDFWKDGWNVLDFIVMLLCVG